RDFLGIPTLLFLTPKMGDGSNDKKEGRGNLLGRAEKLRKLGIKSSKTLPASLVDPDEDELLAPEVAGDRD
ncbi:MAG: hypothetical protein EBY15_12525, partial [Gammaproteobacteria bacterium]|nr:hypothetical protein [Gammaproteobacteria bacterium]